MHKRIMLSGSHGTGKSTIINGENNVKGLAVLLPHFDVLDSASEKFLKKEDLNPANQNNVDTVQRQQALVDYQCKFFQDENIITSRSYADMYAYIKHMNDNVFLQTGSYNQTYSRLMQMLAQKAKKLDTLYIVVPPVTAEIAKKDLRSTNKNFQQEIELSILKFYLENDIKFYYLKSTGKAERVQEIMSLLDD